MVTNQVQKGLCAGRQTTQTELAVCKHEVTEFGWPTSVLWSLEVRSDITRDTVRIT